MRHHQTRVPLSRRRKLIRRVLPSLLVAFGIAACGDDDDGTGPSEDCADEFAESEIDEDDVSFISFGSSRNGSLTGSDLQDVNGYYFDIYVFALSEDEDSVLIEVTSNNFDTYLHLYNENLAEIRSDDDGGSGTNSAIYTALSDGCYAVEVSSFDPGETGSYRLSVGRE